MTQTSKADHVIFAPHCDDALLAMGGRIQLLEGTVKVVTIFGTCAWTARPDKYDLKDVTRINQQEERQALEAAGCTLVMHEYPEALLRGYRKWNTKRPHTSDKALAMEIRQVILREAEGAKNVYFPLAPGRHVDHQLIASQLGAVYEILRGQGIDVFAFEDLPYSWYGGVEEQLAELRKRYTLVPSIMDCSEVFSRKIALLKTYDTQLAESDLDKVSKYAQSLVNGGYGERVWQVTK